MHNFLVTVVQALDSRQTRSYFQGCLEVPQMCHTNINYGINYDACEHRDVDIYYHHVVTSQVNAYWGIKNGGMYCCGRT